MIRDLIGRDEADTKAANVLTTSELSTAADIRDSVVVTLVVTFGKKGARPVQAATVGELTAIEYNEPLVGDVKNHRLRFGVVRILNEFKGHDVIALKSRQVTSDVSKQVRGVRAADVRFGHLIHFFPILSLTGTHRVSRAPRKRMI
ncbi:TPA: hypothetical protein NIB30_004212 [Pseudomonas aeruginosa]|nr:hypothetical protein [Pseudomonas aeruginosa]